MELLLKYLSVFLISTLKFIGGPVLGEAEHLSFLETFAFTVLGMMATVVIVTYLGTWIRRRFFERSLNKRKSTKPNITPKRRRLVRIWQRFGIRGLAFLTPIFFSPVIGTVLAVAFGERRPRIIRYMLVSAVFWGLILTFAVHQLGHLIWPEQ